MEDLSGAAFAPRSFDQATAASVRTQASSPVLQKLRGKTMDRSRTGMPAAAKRSKPRPMAPRKRAASTVPPSLEPLCEIAQRWFDAPLWAARSTRRCGVSTASPAAMRRSTR